MSYKVGDKVLLEGEIFKIERDNIPYPYGIRIAKNVEFMFGEEEISKTYEDGLNDAWELVRKLYDFSCNKVEEIYGVDGGFYGLMKKYTPQQALKILEAYEKSKQIQVGDVVRRISDDKEYLIITRENDNSAYNYGVISLTSMIIDRISYNRSDFEKTGRHIDISSLLEQIRGNE